MSRKAYEQLIDDLFSRPRIAIESVLRTDFYQTKSATDRVAFWMQCLVDGSCRDEDLPTRPVDFVDHLVDYLAPEEREMLTGDLRQMRHLLRHGGETGHPGLDP